MPVSESLWTELGEVLVELFLASAQASEAGLDFDPASLLEDAAKWQADEIGKLIKDLDETDLELVKQVTIKGREEGWTMAERQAALSEAFGESRALLIARTEDGFAGNGGAAAQYEAEGVEYVDVLDGKGCLPEGHDDKASPPTGTPGKVEANREAHGQRWTIEQMKEHPLGHPNCERAFAPVVPKRR